jgi:preprotein translocase subunit SecG
MRTTLLLSLFFLIFVLFLLTGTLWRSQPTDKKQRQQKEQGIEMTQYQTDKEVTSVSGCCFFPPVSFCITC